VIVVEKPGLRTTVQDLGRPGLAHLGVPRSGAADPYSLRLANALVGNPDGAAVLETTIAGPSLRFDADAVVALTGAPAELLVDDERVEFGCSLPIAAGQLLRVGRAAVGVRSYLAVAGGIDVPAILGSRARDTLAGLGPAALRVADVLPLGAAIGAVAGRRAPNRVLGSVLPDPQRRVRVVLGPASDWFSPQAMRSLCHDSFVVSPRADRVGVRLTGPVLERARAGEAPTQGMVVGALQVPPDGVPVVLLADHAVTGGYPVIAVVCSADLPLIAQARPGTRLRFSAVSVAEASAAWADAEQLLVSVRHQRP
jgi:biotin-dependent carboxylase-like uncharacterized protein